MSSEQKQEVVQLEVDKILVPEDRVTSVMDEEIEAELEASIKQHGILQPLQVALVNNQYILIDGLHRLRIAKKLGMKTVPAIIKPMSEDQLLITNLIMNRQRGRSNPAQEALILAKLVDEYQYDFDKAAELLGMSRSTADKYYRIAKNTTDKVLDYLGSGLMSVGCAYWLSYLEDKNKQNELAEYIVKWGYTVDQCRSAVMSIIRPEEPQPYIFMPTGEVKPKPVPVYPCGKEVDPSKIVVVQIDADVWPIVQEAFKQLCAEGFFYGKQELIQQQQSAEEAVEEEEIEETPPPPPPKQPQAKKDWFLEKL
jgi:ParB family chromosome partitioning protein